MVGGELTDAIGTASISELVGHRQHLVGLQGRLQRYIAKCTVQCIF